MQKPSPVLGRAVRPSRLWIPVALYAVALGGFVLHATTHTFFWWEAALGANALGVVAAVVLAVSGGHDLFGIVPPPHARSPAALAYAGLSAGALASFVANLLVQQRALANVGKPEVEASLVLSGLGVGLALVGSALGASLLQKYNIGARVRDELMTARLAGSVGPALDAP